MKKIKLKAGDFVFEDKEVILTMINFVKKIYAWFGKPAIHKARYRHSQWYYYIKPKRLTLKHSVPIYKWLFWVFCWSK